MKILPDILSLLDTAPSAQEGVRIENASETDPLVVLKHFGPGNPDAEPLARRQNHDEGIVLWRTGWPPVGGVTRAAAHDPPTAGVYRLRLTSSWRISSDVVMTRELAWKPR